MSVLERIAQVVLGPRVPAGELPGGVPDGVTVRRNR